MTVHVSPLRIKVAKIAKRYPSADATCLEDWLLDLANLRGARIVVREHRHPFIFAAPSPGELSNEELVVAICQLQGADRPQLLRLAAQLISRGILDMTRLKRIAIRERAGPVLKALAIAALKVDPDHLDWNSIARAFATTPLPHDAILHWTRIAEPVMSHGRCNAAGWRLVA